MADLQKTIQILFTASDKTGNTLTNLGGSLTSLKNNASDVTEPLANLATSILKTETAILALAGAYGAFAVGEAIKFQDAQIDLNKVLQDGDPSINSFTKSVTKLSEQYGVSASEILQGTANFKQAGFTASESGKLQEEALRLIIAGDVEATQATDILVRSLKGFGAEAKEASRFTEALNNVSNKYNTNVTELATGVARLSPIAKAMGFSFEQTTGLLTPIIEVFGSGAEASNALRTGLLKLTDDSKPVRDALAKIGVSQFDVNGKMRSGKDIFFDVSKAFQSMTKNQKLVTTSQLVGTEQAVKMVKVFDNLKLTTEITNVALEKTGSVGQEVALRLNSTGKQIDIARVSFANLGRVVGEKLLPSFGDINQGATDIIQAFRDIIRDGGLDKFFDALGVNVSEFGETLKAIAVALPDAFDGLDFSGLLDSFAGLKGSVSDIFGDLDLTQADDLQKALQGLINFLSLLTNASSGVIDGLAPLFDGIVTFLGELADNDGDTTKFVGELLGMTTAVNALLPSLGFFATALSTLGGALSVLSGANLLKSTGVLTNLVGVLKNPSIGGGIAAAIGAIGVAINTQLIPAYDDWQERNRIVKDGNKSIGVSLDNQQTKLKEISNATGLTITTMDEFNTALDEGRIILDDSAVGYAKAGKGVFNYKASVEETKQANNDFAGSVSLVATALEDAANASKQAGQDAESIAEKIKEAEKNNLSYGTVLEDGKLKFKTWGGAAKEAGKALEPVKNNVADLTEIQKQAIITTGDLEQKMAELESNEYVALLEFSADIEIAQIEADARAIEAAFESVTKVFESASDAFASIFSAGPNEGDTFGFDFDRALADANRRADTALENATKLNDAEIKNLNAKTKALQRGDAKIKIVADNLEPELQAVLLALIKNIQVQANAEGVEMLL